MFKDPSHMVRASPSFLLGLRHPFGRRSETRLTDPRVFLLGQARGLGAPALQGRGVRRRLEPRGCRARVEPSDRRPFGYPPGHGKLLLWTTGFHLSNPQSFHASLRESPETPSLRPVSLRPETARLGLGGISEGSKRAAVCSFSGPRKSEVPEVARI